MRDPETRNIIALAAWGIVAALVAYCVVYRFAHPDMTETRLFLQLWWAELAMLGFAVLALSIPKKAP